MDLSTLTLLAKRQKESLDFFYQHIDLEEIASLSQKIAKSSGKLIFSGMGKSGFIAKKLASSFLSLGKQALFLSPAEGMHGDLGMIRKEDIFLSLSRSGQTKEILQIVPYIKKRGASIVSFLSDKKGPLFDMSDQTIFLPLLEELCPFNLAPTTSCILQLLAGDLLMSSFMKESQTTLDEYSQNHPGGMIGNSTWMHVEEVMLAEKEIPTALAEEKLLDKLCELTEKQCGCLVVVDKKRSLQGVFTDGDLRRAIQQKGESALHCTLAELMTPKPKAISQKAKLIEAIRLMEKQPFPVMVLPVIDQSSQVVGIVRMHDIIQRGLGR